METSEIIRELYQRKDRIEAAIQALSGKHPNSNSQHSRGRGKMSAAEKKRISIRMKKFWRDRKRQKAAK